MENGATTTFDSILESRGVSRRSFMALCGTVAAAAGLSQLTVAQVAEALEKSVIGATKGNLYPVIWMEGASCTGCTESFAQIENPDPATVVLDLISLNYCETLSAAAGYSMEEARKQTIEAGNYILVYEGSLSRAFDGNALRIAGETGMESFLETAEHANAVVAYGSCAVNGGWTAAYPNASDAVGCQQAIKDAGFDTPVINVPGCPPNPEWLVAVLVDVVLLGVLPELNAQNKPAQIFNQTIHDNCQRRGHFENGEFVYQFGSEEEKRGYCLYPMGCRGPQTRSNCGIVRYNNRRSWCVESGAPCIGCCEADPMNSADNWVDANTPFFKRNRDFRIANFVIQPSVAFWGLTGLVAAALVVHGFGMKAAGRMGDSRKTELVREWDLKHPEQSIGVYDEHDIKEALEQKKGGK